jgi:hypothetical protein
MVPTLQTKFKGSYAPNAPSDMYAGIGKNGQLVCISPSLGIVLIRMGNTPSTLGEVPYYILQPNMAKIKCCNV